MEGFLEKKGVEKYSIYLMDYYGTNPPLYPSWQKYFREHQPPVLVVYGKNDYIFPESGAQAYKKDLKNLEFHLFDTGHFALESYGKEIADRIRAFLDKNVN